MKFIDEEKFYDKKIIIRCDFNVPIKDGKIMDNTKIVKSLKTIKYFLENNSVILLSHMGRIKTREDKINNTLKPVADELTNLLNKEVIFVSSPVGMDVIKTCKEMQNGDVVLLENTRFKVTIIMIVLLGFMAFGTITERMTFIEGIYNVMTWDYFIMVLLFLFMFNTYNIYTELTHNYSFMIRIKDYKEFFNKMIKFIFISNLIIYFIVLVIVMLCSILNTGMNMKIDNYYFYNISNSLYLIFHIIRSYFILNIVVVFSISVYKLVREEIGILIVGIIPLSISMLFPILKVKDLTSVFMLPLYYGEYFISNNYGTFSFEICMSILFISLIFSISKLFMFIVSKKNIDLEF